MNWLQGCHVLQSVLYCKKLHRRKILPHNTFLLLHLILSRSDLGTKWVITRVVTSGISDKWRRQYPVTLSWVPGRWHQSCWQYCDNIITENWTLNKKIMSHVLSFFRVLSSFRKRSYTTIEIYFILLSQKTTQDMTINLAPFPSPKIDTLKYRWINITSLTWIVKKLYNSKF